MKIFITGGAGYVGSRLVPELLKDGHEITVFDILYFGKNFLPLENNSLKVIKGDIRDTSFLVDIAEKFDIIVLLAALVGDPACSVDQQLTSQINYNNIRHEAHRFSCSLRHH